MHMHIVNLFFSFPVNVRNVDLIVDNGLGFHTWFAESIF